MKSEQLAKAFNKNVAAVDATAKRFAQSADPTNTQDLRKATRRLRTSYSLLPKKLRRDPPIKRYVGASRKLSGETGRVRDLDTIAAWTAQVADAKDRRSFASDLEKLRTNSLRPALREAKELRDMKAPSVDPRDFARSEIERRLEKVEKRLVKKVDKEFEEFLSTQEVEVMHALRKDSKRLRHLLELAQNGHAPQLLERLRSIQDDLGAIRDHDLVIDYLSGRVRLTSTRALIREEIAKRHARLEDFVTKNRGQGRVVPISTKASS